MQKEIIGITGASGVLGRYFIKKYQNYKYDIFKNDIKNLKEVNYWVRNTKAKYILHFASKVSTKYVTKNYKNSLRVNYIGTKNLVDSILLSEKKIWLFFASTSHVYKSSKKKLNENHSTKPISLYGKTKLKAENYLLKVLKKKKIKVCIGRIFSFTDKNQSPPYLLPSLLNKMKKINFKINLKNLNHERDFCHIDDLCRAINLLKKKQSSGIFNIGSGKVTNLFNIIKMLNKKNKKIIYNENSKKTSLIADISKINKIGFKPKYGIRKIIKDLKYQ